MSQDYTVDAICRGAVTLAQPRRGYRFNIDSVLLADFTRRIVSSPVEDLVVDLGAGCGVVGLLLARFWPGCTVLMVELQEELARLAEANVASNGFGARARVAHADLRSREEWLPGGRARVVVSNPPFFRLGSGRVSGDRQVALAKHEIGCRLEDVVRAAEATLAADGGLAMIHAMDRAGEVEKTLRECGLNPRARRGVRPLPSRPCNRVLLWATRRPGPVAELSELEVESRPGRHTPEVRGILGEAP